MAAGRHPRSAFQPLLAAAMLAGLPLALALMFVGAFAAGGFIILAVGWTSGDSGLVAGLGDKGRFEVGFALTSALQVLGFGMWPVNRSPVD